MMLVTGAAGKTGQAVVRNLVAQGAPVRAFVRTAEQATALLALGAAETVVGTFAAADDLVRACTGAATIYHICPNMHPDELQIGRNLLTAAQQTGVARCVYHSVLHPQVEAMAHHWQKLRVEELLFQSGLAYAIVQPAAYMQNVLANWPEVVATGVYRVPYAAHTRLGMVDLADVAAAVTRLLLEPALDFGSYELAGGEILTQDAVAAQMAAHLGRPVRCAAVDRAAWAAAARGRGMNEYAVTTLLAMFDYYERYGFCGSSFVLTQLLGRAPATFGEFLAREGWMQ
jgi:NAD(P)H dehydrogenase (quinone)